MARLTFSFFALAAAACIASTAACSGGVVPVGASNNQQQLKTKKDGTPTGNGTSCSWAGTNDLPTQTDPAAPQPGTSTPSNPGSGDGDVPVSSDDQPGQPVPECPPNTDCGGNGSSTPGNPGAEGAPESNIPSSFAIGDQFKSPDKCNDCQCTAQGIMCTMRACTGPTDPNPGQVCPAIALQCPAGQTVQNGPNCEQKCVPQNANDLPACTDDARQCPDGSYIGRSGPNCEFICPEPVACPADAMQCPDGSYVGRSGPKCEFVCPK